MAGTPDPVLGSVELTAAVSVAVAILVAAVPVAFREDLPPPRRLALGGGPGYAILAVGAWAGGG